ncbi:hypothetical protein G5B30_09940 [Sphingobacterium sp. SGG-5]|uniref:polysaccharide lyase 6 family protein n=1 Tax=Sphingobacterium sp. SGG-5 TaxID=2710881 RepID=UPI0013EBA35A|nr:polysaccharide lyase 6 family protein [Sphingobacterium sp. SGG-5]NGM62235.1 hypothetical protein [Sphingobacterium sp. SGG-5]
MKAVSTLALVFFIGVGILSCSKNGEDYVEKEETIIKDPDKKPVDDDPPPPDEPTGRLVTSKAELNTAIAEVAPGDIIVMKDGVWRDLDIIFTGNGTKEKPITLKTQSPGGVVISGRSSLQMSGEYLVVDGLHFKDGYSSLPSYFIKFNYKAAPAHHSRLTNVVISGYNRPREDGADVWISLFGTNNTVDHCFFQGKTSNSVLLIVWRATNEANYHHIHHNYFKDMPSIGAGGATAIRIGDGVQALSASRTTVEANIFENMLGIGKIINIKSGGNIIKNNTFINASGSICVRQGNGNLIAENYILPAENPSYTGGILIIGEDNIISGNYIQGTRAKGKAAIVLYEGEPDNYPGKGGYYPTKNVLIANNTLIDNDKNILIGQYYNQTSEMIVPVENITYKENVIIGNSSTVPVIQVLDEPIGNIQYEGNIFFKGNLNSLGDIPGISIEDPQLYKGADGMYYYPTGSALEGNIIRSPLKRTDVGPSWIKDRWPELGIEDTPYIKQ